MSTKKTSTIQLCSAVTIEAGAQTEAGTSVPKFVAMPAYSGALAPGYTATPQLPHPYVIDLAGLTSAKNPKVNLDHQNAHRVGHVTELVNDGKTLTLAGELSASTSYRDEVAKSALDGFPWEVSIEGALGEMRKLAAGKTEVVNGQTITGPAYIVGRTKLTGIAFVSRGADEGNSVSIAASAAGETAMTDFEKFVVACGADLDTITDEHRATLADAFEAKQSVGKKVKTRGAARLADIAREEREDNARQEAIKTMALSAMREQPLYIDKIEAFAEQAIDEKWDATRFELALLREMRVKSNSFSTTGRRDTDPKVLEAAICLSAGLPNIENHFSEQVLDQVDRQKLRSFGLQQTLLHVAGLNGYVAQPGERITMGNIRTVLEYCFPPATARMAGGQFSTISLPNILGNVANKELLAGFMEEGQEWREIAQIKPVSNFHTVTSYRMNDDLEYEEVGPGGELKHGTLTEESYTRKAKTYGKMAGLTREDIVNDDVGALDDLRTRLGRGASRKFNTVFWTRFMDNSTFFTSGRGNYIATSTSNLGVDGVGLTEGVLKFRQLRSADGKRITGQPSILLVPPELEWIARGHYTSRNINTGGAATATSVPNDNVFSGLYRPVVVDYLSDSSFTGYGAKIWYLLRDPRILASVVVSFLNGQQTPTVESTDADFSTLGILFRGYHDFGCDFAEYLAGIKSKGEA